MVDPRRFDMETRRNGKNILVARDEGIVGILLQAKKGGISSPIHPCRKFSHGHVRGRAQVSRDLSSQLPTRRKTKERPSLRMAENERLAISRIRMESDTVVFPQKVNLGI